jgi:mRNA-degrading endonuclease toxin of MazEF toxin-antitoxin module
VNLGDVHWVELPDRHGREQSGRRPAVIWQDSTKFPQLPTTLVIPLSSQQSALRFAGTLLIQPSGTNGLSVASVALVFQLGACDVRRIGQRLGRLSENDLSAIREIARKLQGLG